MGNDVENLILEHLKRFQASQDRIERNQAEHTTRLGRLEMMCAGLRKDFGHSEEHSAEQSVRMDRLSERLDRLERRFEIAS